MSEEAPLPETPEGEEDQAALTVAFVPPWPERISLVVALAATVFSLSMSVMATQQHAKIHDVSWSEAFADASTLRGIAVLSAVVLWLLCIGAPVWWRRCCSRHLTLDGTLVRFKGPGSLWSLGTRTWEGEVSQVRGPAQRWRLAGVSLVFEADGQSWSYPLQHGKTTSGSRRWWTQLEAAFTRARVRAAQRRQEPTA